MDTFRCSGLPRTPYPEKKRLDRSYSVCTIECNVPNDYVEYVEYRQRANSWPPRANCSEQDSTTTDGLDTNTTRDRQILAVMTNIAHIIIGIAITQLGIVGTWYQNYMNFPKDHLRHVIYICVLFVILGVYGMCIVLKKLGRVKSHRVAYITLSSLSTVASCFIIANAIRTLLSDNYQIKETVVFIFDCMLIGLSALEVPVTLVGLYATVSETNYEERGSIHSSDRVIKPAVKVPRRWSSIFSIILNVAHIVLGLCITELGMVGMMYRNFMNIDNSGLFSVVFVSLSFISVGTMGIYNQLAGKSSTMCNSSVYTFASLVAVGSATVIMSLISLAMSSQQYYKGIEAIVAFDVMILSMSTIELIVALAAGALCLIPLCISKLSTTDDPVSIHTETQPASDKTLLH